MAPWWLLQPGVWRDAVRPSGRHRPEDASPAHPPLNLHSNPHVCHPLRSHRSLMCILKTKPVSFIKNLLGASQFLGTCGTSEIWVSGESLWEVRPGFFLDAFPAPGILKEPTFRVFTLSFEFFPWVLSFFLEFWHIFSCFSHKTCNFSHKNIRNFSKSADFLGFRLEFWVFSLSFEFFSPWVFFGPSKKKACINSISCPSSTCFRVSRRLNK